jgi:membrane-associated phospholipid phosphatase
VPSSKSTISSNPPEKPISLLRGCLHYRRQSRGSTIPLAHLSRREKVQRAVQSQNLQPRENDTAPDFGAKTANRVRVGRITGAVAVAIVLATVAFHFDNATEDWVRAHQNKSIKRIAGKVSNYGDWPYLMAVAAPVAGACLYLRKRDATRLVITMMLASSVAGIIANTSRLTTGRTRPNTTSVAPGWYGLRHDGKWLIGRNAYNSFPSGHTATAVGFFAPLAFVAPLVGVPMLLVGFTIAASRIYLGAHHLSDITVASLIAFAVSWWFVKVWYPRSKG